MSKMKKNKITDKILVKRPNDFKKIKTGDPFRISIQNGRERCSGGYYYGKNRFGNFIGLTKTLDGKEVKSTNTRFHNNEYDAEIEAQLSINNLNNL